MNLSMPLARSFSRSPESVSEACEVAITSGPLPVNSKAVFMERLLDLCGAEGEGTGGECGWGSGRGGGPLLVQLPHAGRWMGHCRGPLLVGRQARCRPSV